MQRLLAKNHKSAGWHTKKEENPACVNWKQLDSTELSSPSVVPGSATDTALPR